MLSQNSSLTPHNSSFMQLKIENKLEVRQLNKM